MSSSDGQDRSGLVTAVRDGQRVPVTCSTCGCRLDGDAGTAWYHFGRLGGRDARGHRVECVDEAHDTEGRTAA